MSMMKQPISSYKKYAKCSLTAGIAVGEHFSCYRNYVAEATLRRRESCKQDSFLYKKVYCANCEKVINCGAVIGLCVSKSVQF